MFKTGLRKSTGKMIAAAAIAGMAASANAALMTYDMRIASATGAGQVTDSKTYTLAAGGASVGDVITLNLYTVLASANATQTDDGFLTGEGSFKSGAAGTIQGNLRGDVLGTPSKTNNVSPFDAATSTSGVKTDLDADGDLDVGTNVTSGALSPQPWFRAQTSGVTQAGTLNVSGNLEFLIGTTTFTVTDASGGISNINFQPRIRTDGGPTGPRLQKFTVDGVQYSVNDAGVGSATVATTSTATTGALAVGSPVSVVPAPEPASIGLLGVAAAALLRRRK